MQKRFEAFTALMNNISRNIRRIKTEEMLGFNLKGPHVVCIYYLYVKKSLTAKELCDLCEEDKANVSRNIDFLEKNGYIICNSAAHKRYRSPLELTEKGTEVGKYISDKIESVIYAAGEGISEENRVIMYECLSRINENLKRVCDEYSEE